MARRPVCRPWLHQYYWTSYREVNICTASGIFWNTLWYSNWSLQISPLRRSVNINNSKGITVFSTPIFYHISPSSSSNEKCFKQTI
jgi:hypothetical protein